MVFTSHKPSNLVSSRNFNAGAWVVDPLSARDPRERLLLLLFLDELFRTLLLPPVEVLLLLFFCETLVLLFLGEPWGEFCKANSFLLVWGVRPALPIGELVPFFDPPLADDRAAADVEQLLRIAMRDGDKFVGEELMLRGLDAMINHLRVETCYILELKDKIKDTREDKCTLNDFLG